MLKRSLLLSLLALPLFAASSDLGVYSSGFVPPVTLDPNERFVATFSMYSNGPDPAPNVKLTVTLPPGMTAVEIKSSNFGPCTQQGSEIVCTASAPAPLTFQSFVAFTLEASHDLGGNIALLTAHITSDNPDPNPANDTFTTQVTTRRALVVTTNADSGDGSLRAQIETMNATCGTTLPCKVVFANDMLIEPLTPLPAITACNSGIDAGGAAGAPLRVELRGDKLRSGSGLELRAACSGLFFNQGVTIRRLAIGDFPENGIGVITGPRTLPGTFGAFHTIRECSIGTDATGAVAHPNHYRGIATNAPDSSLTVYANTIDHNTASGIAFYSIGSGNVQNNHIGSNGASGIFAANGDISATSNEIAGNGQYGISTIGLVRLMQSGNILRANGAQPIDFNMDGPSSGGPLRPPVLTDAFYDAASDRTVIRGHLAGNNDQSPTNEGTFHVAFGVGSRNAAGFADVERGVAFVTITPIKRGEFDIAFETTAKGDYRGLLISGYTQYAPFGDVPNVDSSELSNAVAVH